ncbi:response regulator transcription factor [Serratia marcescens]|uniref:response regulator transcription factor n=1 Tax=Serratia marcescens TaxID=615 RepID=UPI0006ECFC53|nr:helix-turn-helix transcriptional regulator [Serratia marcescens]ALL35899.1 helix-turn-helix transcriptional regulator [Serratia marcescens]PHI50878.1 helix-turn-helix transcriptional regulator [Serratia marcescens]UJA54445.1 helix-turn-helix transcriptional regulator [Serratia marcescens]HDU7919557.1 helix-turn-helix transcriptional regulator [Serratia marcescens]
MTKAKNENQSAEHMTSTKNGTIKTTLAIRIIDDDSFYTIGLIKALSNHLKHRNIRFYTGTCAGIAADIVFQAIRCGTLISPGNRLGGHSATLYFAIAERKDAHLQHLYRGLTKSNILYRHQSVNSVLQLIGNTLLAPQPSPERTRQGRKVCHHESLTPREQEVLYQLQQGKTHAGVASLLGIKEKTISSHKRAAMKKLNFKRTNELFHWMLQGGLTSHQQRKGN